MINDILRPKRQVEIMEDIRNIELPSYRLSSFLRLIDVSRAKNIKNWCKTVFHLDPSDMEIRLFHDGHFYSRYLKKALNNGCEGRISSSHFSSNVKYNLMRFDDYYAYPRGKLGEIIIDNMDANDFKRIISIC